MRSTQKFFKPFFAPANVRRTRVIRSIREPHGNIATPQTPSHLNAILHVLERPCPHGCVWIPERTVFILLVLKEVGVYRSCLHPKTFRKLVDLINAVYAFRKIPQHMKRNARANSGQEMHLTGVTELFFRSCRCRRLYKLSKTRSRVGEPPRRYFNAKLSQGLQYSLGPRCIHDQSSSIHIP